MEDTDNFIKNILVDVIITTTIWGLLDNTTQKYFFGRGIGLYLFTKYIWNSRISLRSKCKIAPTYINSIVIISESNTAVKIVIKFILKIGMNMGFHILGLDH